MKHLVLFDGPDIFSSKNRRCHHVHTELVKSDHIQVWFTMQTPRGGLRCLVFDEKLHGKPQVMNMLDRVDSHQMWHNWLVKETRELGIDHPITVESRKMVEIRHRGLPVDLQPVVSVVG